MKNNFVFQNIQTYNCYLITCNILVLLFKYLNNNFVNNVLIKIKSNIMHNIVDSFNWYKLYTNIII